MHISNLKSQIPDQLLMKTSARKASIDIPHELAVAFAANAVARSAFENLPPSHQREHVKYVAEAKQPETRTRRAAKTLDLLLEKSASAPQAGNSKRNGGRVV
jgi:uncharacterized protein YdeI (YjbR/CyaY-like superfamily)